MFTNGHETKVTDNPLNDNFAKAEFQSLWKEINRKYAYTVDFDSNELIRKSINHINETLFISQLQYTTTIGRQKADMEQKEIEQGVSFGSEKTSTNTLSHTTPSNVRYDLIKKLPKALS